MSRFAGHDISWRALLIVSGDAAVVTLAGYSARWLEALGGSTPWIGHEPHFPKVVALVGVVTFIYFLTDLYDLSRYRRWPELFVSVGLSTALVALVAGAGNFLLPTFRFDRLSFLVAICISAVGTCGWRIIARYLLGLRRLRERILVVGTGKPARVVLDELAVHDTERSEVVGLVPVNGDSPDSTSVRTLGPVRDLERLCAAHRVDTMVVALGERRGSFPLNELLACKMRGVRVEDYPDLLERLTGKIPVSDLRPSWLIFSHGFAPRRLAQRLKRLFDLTLAAVLLVVAAPVMALVAAAVALESRGPIFFRQERIGRNGNPFVLVKFRSMARHAERDSGPVWAAKDDPRVTRVGRFIRKTRLDELPQLWNVLRGEMSLVGPRPERPQFVNTLQGIVPYYTQRLTVRPGITGWAQVRFPYGASVEDAREKLQYDLYYIKHMSFFMDIMILLSTCQVVLLGRGAR